MSLVGKHVLGSNLNSTGLSSLFSGQKNFIAGLIPAGLAGLFDLAGLEKITSNVEGYKEKIEEESSSKKWLPWLLLLLGLIALFFIWRSCSKPEVRAS
jgi:hypothetical protein